MKKILSIALITFVISSCCNNKCDKDECVDTCTVAAGKIDTGIPEVPDGVIKALEYYVDGGRKASSEIAKKGFAETATMSWYENGILRSVPIKELYDVFDSSNPTDVSYKIINSEVADDVAMVAVDSKFGDTAYTDMFTLVKDGEEWKIISKVYHAE